MTESRFQKTRRGAGQAARSRDFALRAFALAALVVQPQMEIPKIGEVRPLGWLRATMRTVCDGYTGNMDAVHPEFARAWAASFQPRGRDVHWWTKNGSWSAEGGAYWFDGLVRLAFQLDDPALKAMVSNRLETVLTRTTRASYGFCWWLRRDNAEDRAALAGDNFLLSNSARLAYTLVPWFRATGDARAARALEVAFSDPQFAFCQPFAEAFEVQGVLSDSGLAARMDACLARLRKNRARAPFFTPPSPVYAETLFLKYRHERLLGYPTRHGYCAQAALLAALRAWQWTGDAKWLAALRGWVRFFDENCRLPFGQTVSDEEWGWAGANRAGETCTAANENYTRLRCLAVLGEGTWGDDVEESVYNAALMAVAPDGRSHVYLQQPNRLAASDLRDCSHGGDGDDPTAWDHAYYRRWHKPLCCTAGLTRLWPDFVEAMWLKTRDGGVALALYGPCAVATELSGGRFAATMETAYPFDETVRVVVSSAPEGALPLKVKVPRWCAEATATVNGAAVPLMAGADGFAPIVRAWRAGDVLALRFPMRPRVETLRDMNDGGRLCASVKLGPLLFARRIACSDLNTPTETLTELPCLTADAAASAEVRRNPLRIVLPDAAGRPLELVPYAHAPFRVSMFPCR